MPRSLYLIDGHAQIYRAYYARVGELTAPSGEPTRATYVFYQMLLNLVRDRAPDYLAMTLDVSDETVFRKQIYPDYKAHRDPPPEDLPPQAERIVQILTAVGMPILRMESFEADDIMATLAARLAPEDLHVYLVSRDKDLEQLLSDRVSLYDPIKDEVITPDSLYEAKGWHPAQAIDAQALTGDSVDNVPGVPGIGPKTAAKLLQKYGSAHGIIANADELTPKQRENVLAFVPRLAMTRQLLTLRDDVPIEFDLRQADCTQLHWPAARPIFEELGFLRLIEQLSGGGAAAEHPGPDERITQTPRATEPVTTASSAPPPAADLHQPEGGDYRLINTPAEFEAFVVELEQQPAFALDTETTSVNAIDADLVGLSFSWRAGTGYYLPVRAAFGEVLPLALVHRHLAPVLANESSLKVGQNLKYDLTVLRQAGLPVAGPLFDTMIAAFVADPARGSYSMDKLVAAHLGHKMIPISDLIGKGRQQLTMDQVPLDHATEYAAEDADYTWRLKELFEPQLAPGGVDRLFYDTEMPLVSVLTDMEQHGISLDSAFLRQMGGELAARIDQITGDVQALAATPFNLDSPKQLAEILFDELGFRVVKKTKTGRSTDAETLEILAGETGHALPALVLEYRELQKLRSTYVNALPLAVSKRTGRIHTSYHQTGAVTGRLSSSEPNLQNIPVRTELGRQIRRAFVPRSNDELLIVADYSQIELRVLAHFCEDEALLAAFAEDRDIHAFVAAQVNGVPLDAVTKAMRSQAKAVNFGIIYGQTAFGLARTTGMGRNEAQAFIDDYFRRYARIRSFLDRCSAEARRDGSVRTILGRRRPIPNILSSNRTVRMQAERLAVNTVIQGSAADLIKIAMIRLHRRIREEGLALRMLLQVHDELVCESPRDAVPHLSRVIAEVMSGAMELRVPLKVDVESGENWLDAK
ncbi:MAG: DNA polymerase I [Planctomycetes bacterium]|nr:DNA polymerase I [Planctomycetota bacterium]